MHPSISALPSLLFYDSKLLDGDGLSEKCSADWHKNPVLSPYRFFDIQAGRETKSFVGKSIFNIEEINACISIVQTICISHPEMNVKKLDFRFNDHFSLHIVLE